MTILGHQVMISEIRQTLLQRLDNLGHYVPREPGDTADALLCEMLHLVTDGEQGDTWQGPTND